MQRLAIGVGALVLLAALARPAAACGRWAMQDEERGLLIVFDISAGWIYKDVARDDGAERRRLASFYLDIANPAGLRVVANHEVLFDVRGDKLVKRGKPIATIDAAAGTLAFGKRVYAIAMTPNAQPEHEWPEWTLRVQRGDTHVLSSDHASALCAPMRRTEPDAPARNEDEVRRRVMYYLAIREVGL